jgi:hypothetical protein
MAESKELSAAELETRIKEVRNYILCQDSNEKLGEIRYYLSLPNVSASKKARLEQLKDKFENLLIQEVIGKFPDLYAQYPTLLKILMFNNENSHIIDIMLQKIKLIESQPQKKEEVTVQMGELLAEHCFPDSLKEAWHSNSSK